MKLFIVAVVFVGCMIASIVAPPPAPEAAPPAFGGPPPGGPAGPPSGGPGADNGFKLDLPFGSVSITLGK